jgi:hypothetical protein
LKKLNVSCAVSYAKGFATDYAQQGSFGGDEEITGETKRKYFSGCQFFLFLTFYPKIFFCVIPIFSIHRFFWILPPGHPEIHTPVLHVPQDHFEKRNFKLIETLPII